MFDEQPRYMQAVAGAEPVGSYYQAQPEQLAYPDEQGSSYLPSFGHVSDYEPSFGDETSYLTPPELPPPGDYPLTPPEQNGGSNQLAQPEHGAMYYIWTVASIVSGAACTYHGYKRNQSIGWALGWGMLGSLFPVIVPAIAYAQGFGKRKAGR